MRARPCFPATTDQHPPAACPSVGRQLLREPALSDPGLPLEQEEASVTGGKRVVDTGDQLAQLAFPADEDIARALLLGPREVEARVLAEDRLVELPGRRPGSMPAPPPARRALR